MATLQEIVTQRLEQLGLGSVEAATRGGMERTYIRDIVEGKKKSVRSDKMAELARALELDFASLSRGELKAIGSQEAVGSEIPLMGYIGAGAEIEPEFEQVPPDGLEQIYVPFAMPAEMIALGVKGDSMLPAYRDGAIIIAYREQRRPLTTFFGEDAAVRTSDGRRFLKTIMRGADGLVNLFSWNAAPIENVSLEWIGEIFAVLPPAGVRRVIRQGGIQGQFQV
jgi:phage repressor protein C with HTH and peptisase S24 domain